jgi:hypothetical protein
MRRISVFTAVATLAIASVFLLAKSNQQAVGVGIGPQSSIDILALHMNARIGDLPVVTIDSIN